MKLPKTETSVSDAVALETDVLLEVNKSTEETIAKSLRKGIIFFLVFFVLILAVFLSPLKQYVHEIPKFAEHIAAYGYWGAVIYVVCVALYSVCGGPRLLIYPVGGMAFGFLWGLIWTQLGVMISYYVLFLFVRWGGRSLILKWFPRLRKMTLLIRKGGIPAVMMVRQLPLYGVVITLILALSPIRHRSYLIGSMIGTLPAAIPCTLLGSTTSSKSVQESMWIMIAAVVIFSVIWLYLKYYISKKRKRKNGAN